eukprot:c11657_g1_i3.p1 GENE.c11657_g1_i3~~c11657_g1_i3.p1  ORF type:complete len:300 (-),score=84.35 c11657_g1_i3:56-955(-)
MTANVWRCLPVQGYCVLVSVLSLALTTGRPQLRGGVLTLYVLYLAFHVQRCRDRNADWRNGVALFESSLKALPGNEYLYWGLAQHLDINNPRKEQVLLESLKINPEFDKAYLDLAEIYRTQGKLEKALEYAKTGVTLPRVMLQLWTKMMNILGDIWYQQQQYQLVLNVCHHVLMRDSDNVEAIMNQANVEWSLGHHEAAEKGYLEALARDPKRAGAYNNLGVIYQQQDKLKKAYHMYQQGSKLAGAEKDKAFWNSYGALLCKMEKYKDAVRVYNHALSLDPEYPEAKYGVAYAEKRIQN